MNWRNFLKSTKYILNVIKKQAKHIYTCIYLWSFCKCTPIFILLFSYAHILDALVMKQFKKAIVIVGVTLVSTSILNFLANYLDAILGSYEDNADKIFASQVNYKSFIIRYDIFEQKKCLEKIHAARNNTFTTGGVGSFVENIKQISFNLLAIIYSILLIIVLYLKAKLNAIWIIGILFLFVIFTIFGIWIEKKKQKVFVDLNNKNLKINFISDYLINKMLSIEVKKEILFNEMYRLFEHYIKPLLSKIDCFLKFGMFTGKIDGIYAFLLTIFAAIVYIYIAYLRYNGLISIGSILLYVSVIQQMLNYISTIITKYNDAQFILDYLKHLNDFLSDDSILTEGTLPIEKRKDNEYEFTFKNVSFAYPDSDKEVLSNINLTFKVGETMAIVGRNGAGKTTIVKLLCRLYKPTKGQILLNGIDIQKFDFNEYTRIFSPVFQNFSLFNMSVEENINCGHIHNEDITEILKTVDLHERIFQDKDKLKMILEDHNKKGVKLSGGQAQKLAIARALYKDAPFIILDEPTAALDPFAEAEIYQNFAKLIKNKTAIYISHRMSSCHFCDRIVVFKNGRIVEDGNHDSLMQLNGEYHELYETQAKYYAN